MEWTISEIQMSVHGWTEHQSQQQLEGLGQEPAKIHALALGSTPALHLCVIR